MIGDPSGQMLPNSHTEDSAHLDTIESELRKVMDDFVKVYERLDLSDDATCKPNYSYTELVYLAILRSPNFCLPITEIYRYIKSRFSFFRQASSKSHWKNAVRHSLSKTKCFTKIGVARGSRYSANSNRAMFLWCILPSSIVSFARGDYRPSVDKESGTNTLRWGYYRVNAGQFWNQVAVYLQAKFDCFERSMTNCTNTKEVVNAQKCDIPDEDTKDPKDQPTSAMPSNSPQQCDWIQDPQLSPSLDSVNLQSFAYSPNASADSGTATGDENSPITNAPRYQHDDSGHETSDSSPGALFANYANGRLPGKSIHSSFLSVPSPTYDDNRASPDLPDLGHVSPSELSKYCDSPSTRTLSLLPVDSKDVYPPMFSRLSPTIVQSAFDFPASHYQSSPLTSSNTLPLQPFSGGYPDANSVHMIPEHLKPYMSQPTYAPKLSPNYSWPMHPIQGHDVMLPTYGDWGSL